MSVQNGCKIKSLSSCHESVIDFGYLVLALIKLNTDRPNLTIIYLQVNIKAEAQSCFFL